MKRWSGRGVLSRTITPKKTPKAGPTCVADYFRINMKTMTIATMTAVLDSASSTARMVFFIRAIVAIRVPTIARSMISPRCTMGSITVTHRILPFTFMMRKLGRRGSAHDLHLRHRAHRRPAGPRRRPVCRGTAALRRRAERRISERGKYRWSLLIDKEKRRGMK